MNKRIAIPVENEMLCLHFGHCEYFYIAEVNVHEILEETKVIPPAHEPGLYPAWVAEKGVTLVIAGGMGEKAKELFRKENIELRIGAITKSPKELILDYLEGTLSSGANACTHK